MQTLGSNLILNGEKLSLDLKKPFSMIEKIPDDVPEKNGVNTRNFEAMILANPILRGGLDDVRTYCMENAGLLYFPSFKNSLPTLA